MCVQSPNVNELQVHSLLQDLALFNKLLGSSSRETYFLIVELQLRMLRFCFGNTEVSFIKGFRQIIHTIILSNIFLKRSDSC